MTGTAVTGDAGVADSAMSLTHPEVRSLVCSSAPSPRRVTAAQID